MDSLDSNGRIRDDKSINDRPAVQWWDESPEIFNRYDDDGDDDENSDNNDNDDNDMIMDDYTSPDSSKAKATAYHEVVRFADNLEYTTDCFDEVIHRDRRAFNGKRLVSPPPVPEISSEDEDGDNMWIDDVEDVNTDIKTILKKGTTGISGNYSPVRYSNLNMEGFPARGSSSPLGKNQIFSQPTSLKQLMKHRRSPIRKQQNQQLRQQQIVAYKNRELKEERMKRYNSRQIKRGTMNAGNVYQSNGCWNRSGKMASSRVSSPNGNSKYLTPPSSGNKSEDSDRSTLNGSRRKKVQFVCN